MFARFGVLSRLSSDGGPELVAKETQDFFKWRGVIHRLLSVYFPSSNGRAEVSIKAAKRMLHNNIKKDGSLDTDWFAAALTTKQFTPEYGSELSPLPSVSPSPYIPGSLGTHRRYTWISSRN